MRPFGDRVPAWPPLAGAVALLVAAAVAGLAPLLSALPALAAGLERSSAAIVLLAAALSAVGVLAVVVFVARLTRPVTAEQLGLRAPEDPARAVLLVLGAAVALAAVAAAWQALGDVGGSLSIPPELDTRSPTAQIYDLPVREPVAFGPGLLASALARCVLPVVAGEVLLRGLAFPALSAWKGPLPAALIVAVLFGGLASLAGQPGVAVVSMLLGLALCGLYLVTGSLLPGIALAATASAVALGVACALPPLGIAALAAGCALAATAIAAGPAGRRHGARGRPVLRGSAA